MFTSSLLRRLLFIAALAALVALSSYLARQNSTPTTPKLATAPKGASFVLTGQAGEFNLAELKQPLALIYFGYTWCPDICPTSMYLLENRYENLPANLASQLQVIFISLDPARDTPEHLATYASFFNPSFLGLTGNENYLAQLATSYGVAYKKVAGTGAMGYTLDHSSNFYLVNRQGKLLASLPPNFNQEQLTSLLNTHLP